MGSSRLSSAQLEAVISEVDTDGDGTISKGEFMDWMFEKDREEEEDSGGGGGTGKLALPQAPPPLADDDDSGSD
jgi:hypothetical protein